MHSLVPTSAAFLAELKRLIPGLPANLIELDVSLRTGKPVQVTARFHPEWVGGKPWPEAITKTFSLVETPPHAEADPGLSTAQAQAGPSA